MDIDHLNQCVKDCTKCDLSKTRRNSVPGEGPQNALIMFIGEAPGHVNDELGKPFVGHGGAIFNKILRQCGIARSEVFVTNVVKCWPPGNRKPSRSERLACSNHLDEELRLVQPKLIVVLGGTAAERIMGHPVKIKDCAGVPFRRDGIHVVATFHPNALRYIKGGARRIAEDIMAGLKVANIEVTGSNFDIQGQLFDETN